jgi:hypothetical protein
MVTPRMAENVMGRIKRSIKKIHKWPVEAPEILRNPNKRKPH